MTSDVEAQKPDSLIPMSGQQLLRIVLVGALAGIVTWGVTLLLNAYVFDTIVCQGSESRQCASSLEYASAIATVLAAGLALVGMVKLQVFRSLLVVLAAAVSLWGIEITLQAWAWQYALSVSLLLFAVAYGAFAWIARIRSFILAVTIIVVLIVAVRLVLNA